MSSSRKSRLYARAAWAGETDVQTLEAAYRNQDAVPMHVLSNNLITSSMARLLKLCRKPRHASGAPAVFTQQ
jgi:hypothetical protein